MSKVRVSTGSRLHFGLLRLPSTPDWPIDGTSYYGGAGLMIADPGVTLVVEVSDQWSAAGLLSARAISAGQRFAAAIGRLDRFSIQIVRCPSEHVGLGVGTQLELAVAAAIARVVRREDNTREIASMVGRGLRSGIGVHGFAQGGFLIDEGKQCHRDLSVVRRREFPEKWFLLIVKAMAAEPWHGDREEAVFAALGARSSERMTTLLQSHIEPALLDGDIRAFGDALTEYNALAGECFRGVQSGRYANPFVEETIAWLRDQGAAGVGQSSWGPTVFSIWDDPAKRTRVYQLAKSRWGEDVDLWATMAMNRGAAIAAI